MKSKNPLFLKFLFTVLITSVGLSAEAKTKVLFSKSKMSEFKKNYDLTKAAGQPAIAVEQLFKDFKIKTVSCAAKTLTEKIKSCSEYTCVNKTTLSGVPALEEIQIRRNDIKTGDADITCSVSTFDKKYNLTDAVRASFAEIFSSNRLGPDYAMTALQLQSDVLTKNQVSQKEVVRLGVDLCRYDIKYEFAADLKGFVEEKSVPFVKPGVSVNTKGSHFTTLVMLNGKTYRPTNASDANPKVYAKLIDFKMDPSSSTNCKNNSSDLIFNLEKSGRVEPLFPIEN